MAWRVVGNSPLLHTATGATTREGRMSAFLLNTTSTATVVIEEDVGWLTVPRLRMYGFGADRLEESARTFGPAGGPLEKEERDAVIASWACGPDPASASACPAVPDTLGFTCPENRVGYIDSGVPAAEGQDCAAPYTTYDPNFALVVDELPQVGGDDAAPIFAACGSVGVCGSTPLRSTCIPTTFLNNQDGDPTWIIEEFEYHEDPLAPGSLFGVLTTTTARVNVMYKDVDVLQLPDGSWFMVMVRLRWRAPPETGSTPPDSCPPGPNASAVPPHSEQLSDIVGWWSPDASFATGQERGPFLVVDSLDALPNLHARFWLGVPGVVIATSEGRRSLFVYYMVEPRYSLVEPPVDSVPDIGPDLHPDLGPGFGPDLDPDLSRFSVEATYRQVVREWGSSAWAREPFVAGPAVKRIDLDDLCEAIGIGAAAPAASTDQPTWTRADAIPGGLLGQIRVWLTHPELTGPRPAVRSWRDGYPGVEKRRGTLGRSRTALARGRSAGWPRVRPLFQPRAKNRRSRTGGGSRCIPSVPSLGCDAAHGAETLLRRDRTGRSRRGDDPHARLWGLVRVGNTRPRGRRDATPGRRRRGGAPGSRRADLWDRLSDLHRGGRPRAPAGHDRGR